MLLLAIALLTFAVVLRWSRAQERELFDISGPGNLNRVSIWKEVKAAKGDAVAARIMPRTYLLPQELDALLADANSQFILKTFRGAGGILGQRSGVALYSDKKLIRRDHADFVLGQVFIRNPYLVRGHKFDVRIFLVAHCGRGVFLYRPAYCVYAYRRFRYEGLDRTSKINQVHTDESHYDINRLPRRFDDFCATYLSPADRALVQQRLARNLRLIVQSVRPLCDGTNRDFHIYGVDVELTDDLEPRIIEINQSPALRFDVPWKQDLIRPMLRDLRSKDYSSKKWERLV